MRISFPASLVAVALSLLPVTADAETQLGLDLDSVFANEEHDTGLGIAGRVGFDLGVPGLLLMPELQIGYFGFDGRTTRTAPDTWQSYELSSVRGTVGARVGFGGIVRPSVYAHAGWARLFVENTATLKLPSSLSGGRASALPQEEDALTWDAGVAVDLTVVPLVDLGAHIGYARLDVADPIDWWNVGVHAALGF
jgi:hypothetical protein